MSAPLSRNRTPVRAAAAGAIALAALALLWTYAGGTASAHWPTSSAAATCVASGTPSVVLYQAPDADETDFGWTVSFEARSWSKSMKNGGGNTRIDVFYQVLRNGTWGDWVMLPWTEDYMFAPANGFKFDGSFDLPFDAAATGVRVQARSTNPWSDGTVAQIEDGKSDIVPLPVNCAPPTTTTTTTTTTTATTTTSSTRPPIVPETTIVVSPTTLTTAPTTTTPGPTPEGSTTTLVVRSETLLPNTTIAVKAASETLPVTGSATPVLLIVLGLGLLAGGVVVARATRSTT